MAHLHASTTTPLQYHPSLLLSSTDVFATPSLPPRLTLCPSFFPNFLCPFLHCVLIPPRCAKVLLIFFFCASSFGWEHYCKILAAVPQTRPLLNLLQLIGHTVSWPPTRGGAADLQNLQVSTPASDGRAWKRSQTGVITGAGFFCFYKNF